MRARNGCPLASHHIDLGAFSSLAYVHGKKESVMRLFWSVLAVVGVLSATEALAANWNEGTTYLLDGMVDQLERGTIWQRQFGEPEAAPVLLAEMRKRAKRNAPGTARTAFDDGA
jgi:hypothetical protein